MLRLLKKPDIVFKEITTKWLYELYAIHKMAF